MFYVCEYEHGYVGVHNRWYHDHNVLAVCIFHQLVAAAQTDWQNKRPFAATTAQAPFESSARLLFFVQCTTKNNTTSANIDPNYNKINLLIKAIIICRQKKTIKSAY